MLGLHGPTCSETVAIAQDLADAVYRLAAGADTASELLIRALAAVNALRHAGFPIKRDLFELDMILEWGETRPYQWRDRPRCPPC